MTIVFKGRTYRVVEFDGAPTVIVRVNERCYRRADNAHPIDALVLAGIEIPAVA